MTIMPATPGKHKHRATERAIHLCHPRKNYAREDIQKGYFSETSDLCSLIQSSDGRLGEPSLPEEIELLS
jgi:hypothetical protein